jgi:hypothetical protein
METVSADADPVAGDWDLTGATPQKNSQQITIRIQKTACGLPQIFTNVYLLFSIDKGVQEVRVNVHVPESLARQLFLFSHGVN